MIACDGIAGQTFVPTFMPTTFKPTTFRPTSTGTGTCCESKLEYSFKYDETGQVMFLYLLSRNVGDIAKSGCMDGCVYVRYDYK